MPKRKGTIYSEITNAWASTLGRRVRELALFEYYRELYLWRK